MVVKHNNPCGAAVADDLAEALRQALAGDPLSAFGSVLGLNRRVDAATAEVLTAPGLFVEAIAAPDFEPQALEILTTKPKWKANVRLMKVGDLDPSAAHWTYRCLDGGALLQEADVLPDPEDQWKVVTDALPSGGANGRFAFRLGDGAARQVKRHRPGQKLHVAGHRGGANEPRRFRANRHQKGGRPREGASWPPTPSFPSPTRSRRRPPPA